MKQDFTIWRNQILQNPQNISPLTFGMSQDEIMEVFGKPDAVSTMRSGGKSLILKYHDIELHFDGKAHHGLYLCCWKSLRTEGNSLYAGSGRDAC